MYEQEGINALISLYSFGQSKIGTGIPIEEKYSQLILHTYLLIGLNYLHLIKGDRIQSQDNPIHSHFNS